MYYSRVTYVGDGSTVLFVVPFDYMDRSHISVLLDGSEATFAWHSQTQLRIEPAPLRGDKIELKRTTPIDRSPTDFIEGAVITANDLDVVGNYYLLVAQEAADALSDVKSSGDGSPGGGQIVYTADVLAAEAAARRAEAALKAFRSQYLGASATAPTTDGNGDPITAGDIYFDTTVKRLFTWSGSEWLENPHTYENGAVFFTEPYTATQGQTDFTTVHAYVPHADSIAVYLSGQRLTPYVDYDEVDPHHVVLKTIVDEGDTVLFHIGANVTGSVDVSGTLTGGGSGTTPTGDFVKRTGDTMSGPLVMQKAFTADPTSGTEILSVTATADVSGTAQALGGLQVKTAANASTLHLQTLKTGSVAPTDALTVHEDQKVEFYNCLILTGDDGAKYSLCVKAGAMVLTSLTPVEPVRLTGYTYASIPQALNTQAIQMMLFTQDGLNPTGSYETRPTAEGFTSFQDHPGQLIVSANASYELFGPSWGANSTTISTPTLVKVAGDAELIVVSDTLTGRTHTKASLQSANPPKLVLKPLAGFTEGTSIFSVQFVVTDPEGGLPPSVRYLDIVINSVNTSIP
jgi:hypothetical protein